MRDRITLLRMLLTAAEQRAADAGKFAAMAERARAEGDIFAEQAAMRLVLNGISAEQEDAAFREAEAHVDAETNKMRREGASEIDVAGFTASFVLAVHVGFDRILSEARAIEAGRPH